MIAGVSRDLRITIYGLRAVGFKDGKVGGARSPFFSRFI